MPCRSHASAPADSCSFVARHALTIGRRAICVSRSAVPKASEQKALWTAALGDVAEAPQRFHRRGRGQFRLERETHRACGSARSAHGPPDDGNPAEALWQTCRDSVRQRLDDLAQRSRTRGRLERPGTCRSRVIGTLRQIAAQVRQRAHVYEAWGFAAQSARGLGVSVLFTGESGTGKTMAAEVLANELDLDLYRIDLSVDGQQIHWRDRKESAPRIRCGRGRRRNPAVRRGRRSVRQTQRGKGQPRSLRQHRGELPAAAHGGLSRACHSHHELQGRAGCGLSTALEIRRAISVSRPAICANGSGVAHFRARHRCAISITASSRSSTSPAAASATSR